MFEEFRRNAAGPLAAAAAIAAIISGIVAAFSQLGDPLKSMLVSGAGAVGGLVGSSLLQARMRAEERRRALDVLRVVFTEHLSVLESDLRMIASPMTVGEEGYLATNSHLPHYTNRARRTCEQIATAATAAPMFSKEINAELMHLRSLSENLAVILENAVASAKTASTAEEFFIGLGTHIRTITEAKDGPLPKTLKSFIDRKL